MRKRTLERVSGAKIIKILKKPQFSAFFSFTSDSSVSYDRIDKEEIETFPRRFVFYNSPEFQASECAVFFQIEQRI
jgi:hypothetical protein